MIQTYLINLTIAGFTGMIIISQPMIIGIPKKKIVIRVPILLRRIPENSELIAAPSAINATIHEN